MKKNLLFIFADQWTRSAVGHRNNDLITPNIDKFHLDSTTFNNAISTCPLCSPNRAAIITGRYPLSTGVWTNCKSGLGVELGKDEVGIANVLKDNGYKTGYIGKWHLDLPDANKTDKSISGAKGWDAYTPPGYKRRGFDFWHSYGADDNHLNPHYWEDSHEKIDVDMWSVEHETNVAMDFIGSNKKDNFALFLSWNPPHVPLDLIPNKYVEMYKDRKLKVNPNIIYEGVTDHTRSLSTLNFTPEEYQETMRKYYGAITGIDENFGRLIEYLKDNNLYEDTLIVLTADHGELLCAHRLWSKHVWYEESIGVPFYIRYGENLPKRDSDMILNSVDIMPTILGLLSLPIPRGVEGEDLSENILKGIDKNREAYIQAYPGQVKAIEKFSSDGIDNLAYGWRGIRGEEYLYVVNKGYSSNDNKQRLLYNLKKDPYQLNPLEVNNKNNPSIAKEYHNKLIEWTKRYNDPFLLQEELC